MEILFTVLNIVLIIILTIIVFLLLLILIPASYNILLVKKDKEFSYDVKFNILLGLIKFIVKNNNYYIKILFFKIRLNEDEYSDGLELSENISKTTSKEEMNDIKVDIEYKKVKVKRKKQSVSIFIRKLKCNISNLIYDIKLKFIKVKGMIEEVKAYPYKPELLKETYKLIKDSFNVLKPKVFETYIEYGTDNSYINGKVSALFALIATKNKNIYFTPDFEENKLDLKFIINGQVSIIKLIYYFIKYYFSKPIKTIRKQNNKKGSEKNE